jgi:diaminopimelate epimerase
VGADGTIRVVGNDGGFRMDYRNADGSIAEMCGNGARCVAALLRDEGVAGTEAFDLHTGSGTRRVQPSGNGRFTVAMGRPRFARSEIPMRGPAWETFLGQQLDLGGGLLVTASALSMGNPHLVVFVEDDPARFHVGHIGPALERDDRFPEGVNVEFARVGPDHVIDARVWERGSGETMACGSGACAVAVAAGEAGMAEGPAVVRFPGGDLEVERGDDGEVLLTGDAVRVFDGSIDLDRLRAARELRR